MGEKLPQGKTTAWAYGAVLAFSTVYLVGGLLLERYWNKKEKPQKKSDSYS